jgi:hypothetical protein
MSERKTISDIWLEGPVQAAKVFLCIAIGFAFVAAGLFLQDLRKAAVELQKTAIATTSLVQEAHARVMGTSQNLNAILLQVGMASDEVRRASVEQRAYWNQLGDESVKFLQDSRVTIDALQTTATDADRDLARISDSTVEALDSVPPAMQSATKTLDASTKAVSDAAKILESPTIPETQQHIDNISSSLDVWVKRVTKPASVVKSVIWKILGIGGPIAAAAAH